MMPGAADRWKAFAAQGFIVATADVRGRGDSDGTFSPFINEGSDGVATIGWLRSLPECNGRIGAFGTGYAAFCAWAALAAGAQINAVASISPFGAVGQGLCHRGGAVRLDWLFWMHLIGGRTLQPAAIPTWPQIHRHLPMISMDAALGRADIEWSKWLCHLDPADSLWVPLALADQLAKQAAPALHITGWWDAHIDGARYYYEAATRSGAPQRLIIGPWDTPTVRHPRMTIGGIDFGPRSVIDIDEYLAQFFSAQLHGENTCHVKGSTRLFVTGRNEWLESEGWPVGLGEPHELCLSSGGSANTRRGDGILTSGVPLATGIDEVTDNPAVPVNFQPNFTSFAAGEFAFTLDQSHISARDEALVYTSAPLREVLTVIGRPSVTIAARTSAPDADLYVLLSDVFPLGSRDMHLSHAAIRLATLQGFEPGKVITFTLEMDELVHDFLPSHSVRLSVVPSLFPLYARNLHQASYVDVTQPVIAVIEVHHGPMSGVCITLPTPLQSQDTGSDGRLAGDAI
jgi:uncharacterized protein